MSRVSRRMISSAGRSPTRPRVLDSPATVDQAPQGWASVGAPWYGSACCPPWDGLDAGRGHGRQHAGEHLLDVDVLGERLVGQQQSVAQDLGSDVEDVLGRQVVAAAQQGERPATADQADRRTGAGAELDEGAQLGQAVVLGRAGAQHQVHRVLEHRCGRRTPGRLRPAAPGPASSSITLDGLGRVGAHALDDLDLFVGGGVAEHDLHEEAVALGLGQRVHALGLDRVLGRHHEERRRDLVGLCRRWSPGARP